MISHDWKGVSPFIRRQGFTEPARPPSISGGERTLSSETHSIASAVKVRLYTLDWASIAHWNWITIERIALIDARGAGSTHFDSPVESVEDFAPKGRKKSRRTTTGARVCGVQRDLPRICCCSEAVNGWLPGYVGIFRPSSNGE